MTFPFQQVTEQEARQKKGHMRRYRQIVDVLGRHGLGYVAGGWVDRLAPWRWGQPRRVRVHTRPEHVRLALEELGTTFVKLGQILSTRADLLPPEYLAELSRLQDNVSPIPYRMVEDAIVAELGGKPSALFASFDPNPLTSASIGQAHLATLTDGAEVVVKVRRPGVVVHVDEDLDLLLRFADTAARRFIWARQNDIPGLMREFAEALQLEMDYVREGQSAEHFAKFFENDPTVHIPKIYWDLTTSRVITMERIKGIKVFDVGRIETAGIDRRKLAENGVRIWLRMVFESGMFHADPHPGNLFIEEDGRIGLIDFGMVGVMDDLTQDRLVEVLIAVSNNDMDRLADALMEAGVTGSPTSRDILQRDLRYLLARYAGRSLGEIHLGRVLSEVFTVIRRNRLRLPPNMFLLLKTLAMAEGMGTRIAPDFQMLPVIKPYAQSAVTRRLSPIYWGKRFARSSNDAAELAVELPRHMRRLLTALERGNIEIKAHPSGLDPTIKRLERMFNRLVVGILTAAFIVGLSQLVAAYTPFQDVRWVGGLLGLGVLAALGMGVYLAVSILRSGGGTEE
ncbi:MAG: AarF/ABC1/UbiB kinase family protein [SAR202 cluster bacterium]|nr:AarF/ABC1/UbiB kinase family protein [SAR202 cluster bacterium]